tara:strand:+ start:2361 stop:5909 length:3549 start_codon:yes stop_codon:yes gene_type:complete
MERKITPSELALFSRSPVIGAWWEQLNKLDSKRAPKPKVDLLDQLLFESGHKHEELLIRDLKANGKKVKQLSGKITVESFEETLDVINDGKYDFIHQASLQNPELRGSVDFLERIDKPSKLGDWSYIPIECKLSSHPKPIYLVQACAYCELLEPVLGYRPENFKLYLGGRKFAQEPDGYLLDDFWMWYKSLRDRYKKFIEDFDESKQPEFSPGDHGHWTSFVEEQLEKKRDLTLVAGMKQNQRNKLISSGIFTIDELARASKSKIKNKIDEKIFVQLKEQAAIQIHPPQSNGRPAYEIRGEDEQEKGLLMLPKNDEGDIWFDMEGFHNPITGEKLEYLFGACYLVKKGQKLERRFIAWWAHDPNQEKKAFDEFIKWVQNRRFQYPNLHVYHYANYEKIALGRLATNHGIHKTTWDQWLREELFVDLFPIVRYGLLLGAPSYSIKKVEKLYLDDLRHEEISTATDSIIQYAEWQKSNEPKRIGKSVSKSKKLQDLQDYNQKDCESTEELHKFLIKCKRSLKLSHRPNKWGKLKDEDLRNIFEKDLEVLAKKMQQEIPNPLKDPLAIGPYGLSYKHQQLLSDLIDFHEREAKIEWWEFFDRKEGKTSFERYEDTEVIANAEKIGEKLIKRSKGYIYAFSPEQPLKLSTKPGTKMHFVLSELLKKGDKYVPKNVIEKLDKNNTKKSFDLEGEFDIKNPTNIILKVSAQKEKALEDIGISLLPKYCDLIPLPKQIYKRMLPDLVRQAKSWVEKNKKLPKSIVHLLEKKEIPELIELNKKIKANPVETASFMTDFLSAADGITLSLQGPPGTGKTTVTGELIAKLVCKNKKIVVSSQTHEAINNLLKSVQRKAESLSTNPFVVKLSSGTSEKSDKRTLSGTKVHTFRENDLNSEPNVIGATVFSLVKERFGEKPYDLLVIDEAGQVSLSNLLFMSHCARNILLVGDQNQLSQPNRAKHPGDSCLSSLDYVMGEEKVVSANRGVFLSTSWRMPPALTSVVSDLFYEGELQSCIYKSENKILWEGIEQGLSFEEVEHYSNASESKEEIDKIEELVNKLTGCSYQIVQKNGGDLSILKGIIGPDEILITAPYNLQVNKLEDRLSGKARIGTVDRFQGQEAPISIHSLTASDSENAPRGIGFVLDPDRLNVAISRAQCLSIVVGSPKLALGTTNSVEGVRQLNRLCRIMRN